MASKRPSSEKHRYALRSLTTHLKDEGEHERLFQLIEKKAHLIVQARCDNGFQLSSSSLEEDVLAAAIEERDWQRFLRYTLVALNLREIAVALADEPILRALVQLGHRELAGNLTGQLPDPQVRARARAVITAAADEPRGEEALRLILEDLADVPTPRDNAAAEHWLETLLVLARLLHPEQLRGRWARWITYLEPADETEARAADARHRAQRVWRAVAERWLEHDVGDRSGLWEALAAMADPETISRFLPRRLARSPACDGGYLDQPLPSPFENDERLLHHVRIAMLAHWVREDSTVSEEVWNRLSRLPVTWTPALIEAGRELWPGLTADRLRRVVERIDDPGTRAALWVVMLEQSPGWMIPDSVVLEDLRKIEVGSTQLHWALRYLAQTTPWRPERRLMRTMIRHLEQVRYDLETEDLARFLDIVAIEPGEAALRRQLEGFIWSPACSPTKLRQLAGKTDSDHVLKAILRRAEEYASAVARTPSEGFELRSELIILTASNLCARTGNLEILERAAERLLPEEEDHLRMATINALLAAHENGPETNSSLQQIALEVAQSIRSRRLRLLALLRAATDSAALESWLPPDELPARLYTAVATTDWAEDERLALATLHQQPNDPEALAQESLSRIHDPDRRIQALIDLAWHVLAFQQEAYPHKDPTAAIQPLALAVGGTSSDEGLLALTPELVTVGAQVSMSAAMMEFAESILRVLRLESVSPTLRIEILATLIAQIGPVVLDVLDDETPSPSRCRAVAWLLRWIVQLPARRVSRTEAVEKIWPGLLPILLAAPDHLPPLCRAYVQHPLRTRICVDWFPTVTKHLGLERFWKLLERLEGLLPQQIVRRSPWRIGAKAFHAWSVPAQREILEARLSDDPTAHLSHLAESVLGKTPPDQQELAALAYMLCGREPRLVPQLLRELPQGAERDTLCLWLIRQRWLPADQAEEVTTLCTGQSAALQAKIWHAWLEDGEWIEILADLLGRQGFDPLDPRHAPLRRALRRGGRESDLEYLAKATRDALIDGGKARGEQALRFWLDAFLRSGPGSNPRHFEDGAVAIRQAANL